MTPHDWVVWNVVTLGMSQRTVNWMWACRYWAGAVGVMNMRTGAITWRVTP